MSVVQAKTIQYGPARIDIQVEQGADFLLPVTIYADAVALDLTAATVEAWMSNENIVPPLSQQIALTITAVDLTQGQINVAFPAADSLTLDLPAPTQDASEPLATPLGHWILNVTIASVTVRYAEGQVYLSRAPWLT